MSQKLTKIIILVCNTRTGSTAFGHALAASNDSIAYAGEIFSPSAFSQQQSFFQWLHDSKITAYQFLKEKRRYAKEYLVYLQSHNGSNLLILDMKYHDALNFLPVPALIDFPPTIYQALNEIGGVIIHLKRQDKFASAISQLVAQSRDVYHLKLGEVPPQQKGRVTVRQDSLVHQIKLRGYNEIIANKQINNSGCRFVDVIYEDLFGKDLDRSMSSLAAIIGFKPKMDKIMHQKIGVDYENVVDNYSQLRTEMQSWNSMSWNIDML